MDLKNLLQNLGYDDNQIEAISNKKKIYFQNDVDNMMVKKETIMKEKFEKSFVSKTDYELLQSEYNNLKKDAQIRNVKDAFLKNNGKEEYFNDFLKVNDGILEMEGKQLQDTILNSSKQSKWAFNETQQNTPYGYDDAEIKQDGGFDGNSIYGKWK